MLLVFGDGGFTLQILDTLEYLVALGDQIGVVSDRGGEPVYGLPHFRADEAPEGPVLIAIAAPTVRQRIAARYPESWSLRADSARVSGHAIIGDGHVVCHNAVIEAGAKIGRHFHANVGSFVAHQCVIGDFVTLSPGVICNGNVRIGDGVFAGAGAVIRNGEPGKPLTIGDGATIGMGAVVTRDVPAGVTVIGNPAHQAPPSSERH